MAITTTELTFEKNRYGYYEASFEASGKETFLYVNREDNGMIFIQSTPDEDNVRPCTDYSSGPNGYCDMSFRLNYPAGVLVIVQSKTQVEYAGYVEQE